MPKPCLSSLSIIFSAPIVEDVWYVDRACRKKKKIHRSNHGKIYTNANALCFRCAQIGQVKSQGEERNVSGKDIKGIETKHSPIHSGHSLVF
mmetsp:Transcript_7006/g.14701  ORF Transcript_7006/g.14701 Transcript_7006/m.14701 type:complete len:92 (-) Transcript_7006:396-671(-)